MRKTLEQKIFTNDIRNRVSYLTTNLKEMRKIINKQRTEKKVYKLVLTREKNNNIHVRTHDINNYIDQVFNDSEKFRNAIGLNTHLESNGNEVNISFKEIETLIYMMIKMKVTALMEIMMIILWMLWLNMMIKMKCNQMIILGIIIKMSTIY